MTCAKASRCVMAMAYSTALASYAAWGSLYDMARFESDAPLVVGSTITPKPSLSGVIMTLEGSLYDDNGVVFVEATATIAVMLPVLKDAAAPEVMTSVLFAATIAASCDFALPAGTPPNAIVFGSGYVRIPVMARIGLQLDLLAASVAALWCWAVVPYVLGR